jgi:starvation-inducible DNA-binding protein
MQRDGESPSRSLFSITDVTMAQPAKRKAITTPRIPTDLPRTTVQPIIAGLNPLAADVIALYMKYKNYHWHVSGSHFVAYHELFDAHAAQVLLMLDVLAERVRKLGGTTLKGLGQVAHLRRIQDDESAAVPALTMVQALVDDNRALASALRSLHDVTSAAGDHATTTVIEPMIDECEQRAWFLLQTADGGGNTG